MKMEVSDGEIADKYSILCLKLDRIQDETKRRQVQQEKDLFHAYASMLIDRWPLYYKLLCHVNGQIWDKTNEVKDLSLTDDLGAFARLSHEIFAHNDQRFRLKRVFQSASHVQEQKSYDEKVLHLTMGNQGMPDNKLCELVYMVLEYDRVCVATTGSIDVLMDILPPLFLSVSSCLDGMSSAISVEDLVVGDEVALSLIRHHFSSSARAQA